MSGRLVLRSAGTATNRLVEPPFKLSTIGQSVHGQSSSLECRYFIDLSSKTENSPFSCVALAVTRRSPESSPSRLTTLSTVRYLRDLPLLHGEWISGLVGERMFLHN